MVTAHSENEMKCRFWLSINHFKKIYLYFPRKLYEEIRYLNLYLSANKSYETEMTKCFLLHLPVRKNIIKKLPDMYPTCWLTFYSIR